MKKFLTPALAVIAVIAIVLCFVFAGQRGEKADAVTAKISKAVEDAKNAAATEKDEALAAAMSAADEAVKAAQESADAVKTELEGQVTDLTAKLAEAEESAKTALEAAVKEKDEAVAAAKAAGEEALKGALEAAAKEKDEALAAAQEAADKVKTELEEKVSGLTKQVEEAEKAAMEGADAAIKNAQEAAEAAKAELEGKVADLTTQLDAAKEEAKTALEAALKEKDEAVAAVKAEAEEALASAQEAAEAVKAELEGKVADLTKQLEEAAASVTEEAAEVVEEVKEEAAEAVEEVKEEAEAAEEAAEETVSEDVLISHADYAAAELDTSVYVETYVQATQSWWNDQITIYAQGEDGAYFIYNAACSEEDAAKLVPGTKISVKGFKSEWAGEVEITDAAIEILEGDAFLAEAFDATDLLGKDELIDHQNEKVLFKGLTVAAQEDGAPFNYKNAENKTDDLYVKFIKDGVEANFCVEFYLCGNDTDVYKAVEGLQVGDVVDIEGFLYWYNGANVHMTAVTKAE